MIPPALAAVPTDPPPAGPGPDPAGGRTAVLLLAAAVVVLLGVVAVLALRPTGTPVADTAATDPAATAADVEVEVVVEPTVTVVAPTDPATPVTPSPTPVPAPAPAPAPVVASPTPTPIAVPAQLLVDGGELEVTGACLDAQTETTQVLFGVEGVLTLTAGDPPIMTLTSEGTQVVSEDVATGTTTAPTFEATFAPGNAFGAERATLVVDPQLLPPC